MCRTRNGATFPVLRMQIRPGKRPIAIHIQYIAAARARDISHALRPIWRGLL